jgi:hypothetical protein
MRAQLAFWTTTAIFTIPVVKLLCMLNPEGPIGVLSIGDALAIGTASAMISFLFVREVFRK